MLVIGCSPGEHILIGEDIHVIYLGYNKGRVGIIAPHNLIIRRLKDKYPLDNESKYGLKKIEISENKCVLEKIKPAEIKVKSSVQKI